MTGVKTAFVEPNVDIHGHQPIHCHHCGKKLKRLYWAHGLKKYSSRYCGFKCQSANFLRLKDEFEYYLANRVEEPDQEQDGPSVKLFPWNYTRPSIKLVPCRKKSARHSTRAIARNGHISPSAAVGT